MIENNQEFYFILFFSPCYMHCLLNALRSFTACKYEDVQNAAVDSFNILKCTECGVVQGGISSSFLSVIFTD